MSALGSMRGMAMHNSLTGHLRLAQNLSREISAGVTLSPGMDAAAAGGPSFVRMTERWPVPTGRSAPGSPTGKTQRWHA
jgi:hypothetical protein